MKNLVAVVTLGALSQCAFASCGSAFCTVNTGAEANSSWDGPGSRVDLRYEYVRQDQLRSGTGKVGPAGELGEHDELRTVNRNWRLTLDHNFDSNWGFSVVVPYVSRDHDHIHNLAGESELESWHIGEIGDLQVLGRYRFATNDPAGNDYGVRAGLKFPTGLHGARNEAGELAERSLQPGTGTTDLILGGYVRGALIGRSAWFASATVQSALDSNDDFRPGARFGLDLGASMPVLPKVNAHVQLNLLERRRDAGAQADPADSGGTFAFISPGVTFAIDPRWTLYAFAQVPVYQRVNGVQLTARTGGLVGASATF
jgi:hypothetical protein